MELGEAELQSKSELVHVASAKIFNPEIGPSGSSGIEGHKLTKKEQQTTLSSHDKSVPSKGITFHTKRISNPVDPVYKLPTHIERPPTPPKFIRDSISVCDIEKATPRVPPAQRKDIHNPADGTDIEGSTVSQTKNKTRHSHPAGKPHKFEYHPWLHTMPLARTEHEKGNNIFPFISDGADDGENDPKQEVITFGASRNGTTSMKYLLSGAP